MKLDRRERAAILAGLRLLQQEPEEGTSLYSEIWLIATDFGRLAPLSDEETDALCERLNYKGE